jgi:predicted Rossmann fold nucleotide-binding protein DprA/Smf involved in DNA uptake
MLIQRGEAKPVLHAEDILEEFNLSQAVAQLGLPETPVDLGPEQALVMRLLNRTPRHIDEIYRDAGISMPQVSSTLALLELQNLVRQVGGMHYVVTREAQGAYEVGVD